MSETLKFKSQKYNWVISPAWEEYLKTSLIEKIETGIDPRNAEEIKSNVVRRVLLVPEPAPGLPPFYLKRYNVVNFWHAAHYAVFPHKCKIEWDNLAAYAQRGIKVPAPLFMASPSRRFSMLPQFLAIESIENVRFPNIVLLDPTTDRASFIREFALWTKDIFQKGALMKDFNPGNVLVHTQGDSWNFTLIDLHEDKIGSPTLAEKAAMLARCLGQLKKWITPEEKIAFMEVFAENSNISKIVNMVDALIEKEEKRGYLKRAKSCLKDSSAFAAETYQNWEIIRRRAMPLRQKVFSRAAGEGLKLPADFPDSSNEILELIMKNEPDSAYKIKSFESIKEAQKHWVELCNANALNYPAPIATALAREITPKGRIMVITLDSPRNE